MLATFRRIQEKLFPDHPGGVGEHLKLTIASRFNISPADIPDGYLYWPSCHGGLGLQNPFVSLLLYRREVEKTPEKLMEKYLEDEEYVYTRARARFEEGFSLTDIQANDSDAASFALDGEDNTPAYDGTHQWSTARSFRDAPEFDDMRHEPFMSAEEFARYRERTEVRLGRVYRRLMAAPEVTHLAPSGDVKAALADLSTWSALGEYERWVVQLYHKDIVARFGGVDVVDQGLLPTGLMGMLRESRFRWQG
jgi:hypothetical protein